MQPSLSNGSQTKAEHSDVQAFYKNGLIFFSLFYTLFVIYGSLVPLEFVYKEMHEVVATFLSIRYYSLGLASRADWVANILLFVPLSYAYLELLSARVRDNLMGTLALSVLILASCAILSLSIEFVQIYFPQRTVSLNDVIGETVGAAIGLALWWLFSSKWRVWFLSLSANVSVASRIRQLLYGYILVLLFYNLVPFDLTLSPYVLHDKWQAGHIRFVPLSIFQGNTAEALYGLFTDVIIWLPVGALLVLDWPIRRLTVGQTLLLMAGVIELMQLFVYSRVTDLTDVLTAYLGGWLGVLLMRRYLPKINGKGISNKAISRDPSSRLRYSLLLYLIAPVILSVLYWYPFNFQLSHEMFHERIGKLFSIPFVTYYFSSEYRAMTELTRRVLFFFPLGIIAAVRMPNGLELTRARLFLFGLYFFILASVIELGQVMLPEKFPNSTDIALAVLGGLFGLIGTRWFLRLANSHQDVDAPVDEQIVHPQPVRTHSKAKRAINLPIYLLTLLAAALVIWLVGTWHAMPYNLRELFDTRFPLITALLLSLFVAWMFSFPLMLMDWIQRHPAQGWIMLCYPVIHGGVAWVLLFMAVPIESIDDLVGYPVLELNASIERMVRFIALFSWLSMSLWASIACFIRLSARPLIWSGTLITVPIWLFLSYKVVVDWAATDNITELMANNASVIAMLWLCLALWLIWMPASYLVHRLDVRVLSRAILFVILLPVCLVASFYCLRFGTEEWIVKYDQVFSALQFLLSKDRDSYVAGVDLFFRFLILALSLGLLMIIYQLPLAKLAEVQSRDKNHNKVAINT